jgi:glc operon protein GlcG
MLVIKHTLSLALAERFMEEALKAAARLKVPGAIAIVDEGGHLVLLKRLDNTMYAASNIAIGKAATAVAFKRPTIELEKAILTGRTPMLELNSVTPQPYVPLKGGYPIEIKGEIVGGIAIAGTMDAAMDEAVVRSAVKLCKKLFKKTNN